MANGDSYLRGRVVAVDAATGERRWLFDIIPEPGAIGSDTWPVDSDVWRFGGGGVWMTPTVDVDLGLFYVGSGNAVPMWGGELRPGDNLFTSSVVALDLHTGEYRWHRQLVHHELWEHDLATPLIVYDTDSGRGIPPGAGRHAHRRLPVHAGRRDRRAAVPDRGAAGAPERVPAPPRPPSRSRSAPTG